MEHGAVVISPGTTGLLLRDADSPGQRRRPRLQSGQLYEWALCLEVATVDVSGIDELRQRLSWATGFITELEAEGWSYRAWEEGTLTMSRSAPPEVMVPLVQTVQGKPASLWVWIAGEGYLTDEIDWPGQRR